MFYNSVKNLGVPAKHKTHDLLQFTAPCHADLEYMRVIHDRSPNVYMVLLKFRSKESSKEFYSAYNGLPYNSLEPELCALLPVSWVETCKVRYRARLTKLTRPCL